MKDPEPGEVVDAPGAASERGPAAGVPVVGVGASAGGLDAFTRLLRRLPADTGFAFVLVQHLDANHPSSLGEILRRTTKMPVTDARDGEPVAANRVYVIPPNTELTVTGRTLRLAPRTASATRMPIDRFLRSLALDCGSRAVGVILSGNGSDGTEGLMAIKAAGGMTFAQEPTSAEFPSMPSMAVVAGADVVMPPEGIALELARIVHHPHFAATPPAGRVLPAGDADQGEQLRAICAIMHEATGIDFALYRETTVQRRILRRLAVRSIPDLTAYARLLAQEPGERTALQRDLLIGVTSFFRDPESFDALKRLVFPVLVEGRSATSAIRIWVPGCATGEEAYSILMALQEYQAESHTALPVQVFASDISDTAIEIARAGRYGEGIATDVSPERLARYFEHGHGGYQIVKAVRERCVFSRHNLLEDPPFSRLDLISCRNVLIYLDSVQRKIVPLFHYALAPRGFLMLGRSETTHHADLFAAVEPRQRIYAKRMVARKPYESFARAHAPLRATDVRHAPGEAPAATPRSQAELSREVDRLLLAKFSPPGVLVDESLAVLEIRGQTAPFMALTPGRASFHLLKLLPDTGLFLAVERLTHEAASTGEPVRQLHVPYQTADLLRHVHVEVCPLRGKDQQAFLILFEAVAPGTDERLAPAGPPAVDVAAAGRVEKLTRELHETRARLVSLVDEHEASDEENQQTTEDALSANEELQSLTEELETAKEELQSTNEELLTVNRELESRNLALVSGRDLAKSIVETVGVPLLVTDRDLVIRHANSAFARAFRLPPQGAEGQPLYGVSDGAWNVDELRVPLDALVVGHQPFERVEIEREFPGIGSRVLCLGGRALEDLGLILLTIEDVTTHRTAERALRQSEEQRRQSEKMEVIGRLAGGIAHDFNNLLTVIIGNADLVADALGPDHGTINHVQAIGRASEKAAALTDQLLAFSRRKVLQPKVFDVNPLVLDFERMLSRLLGDPITIVVRTSAEPCFVRADPTEIGRVVMNLCVNARDAMPAGGSLTMDTGHVTLDAAAATRAGVGPGRYVQLVVADTGLGMDNETRRHAFEPFYTTKDSSKGAGLGLSTVFGIMQQSGGAVACDSELGRGTRFTILLPPAVGVEESVRPVERSLTLAPRGSEVVLLVEDDEGVRGLTRLILQRSGYVVLEAKDGHVGLATVQSHPGQIDLLLTDVLMPGLSGGALVAQATKLRPTLKVLFVSGHMESTLVTEGVSAGMAFLQKPYAPGELAAKVRAVLDAKPVAIAAGRTPPRAGPA